ncbi:hypothetical protein [Mycobacterium attenuatum]|uniref:hypothetical protein n=1 Tax=Mycobacterium attenuatum TaxID=2341086 RepID=UPI001459FC7D|nr:hypothetical protein [Mycobacterium attenuatum]
MVKKDGLEKQIAGVGDLPQVQPGVGRGIELVEHLGDGVVDELLQLAQVFEEPVVDREWHSSSVT